MGWSESLLGLGELRSNQFCLPLSRSAWAQICHAADSSPGKVSSFHVSISCVFTFSIVADISFMLRFLRGRFWLSFYSAGSIESSSAARSSGVILSYVVGVILPFRAWFAVGRSLSAISFLGVCLFNRSSHFAFSRNVSVIIICSGTWSRRDPSSCLSHIRGACWPFGGA